MDSLSNGLQTSTWKLPPSTWTPQVHSLAEEVGRNVEEYFLQNWAFPSQHSKAKFLKAGFSQVMLQCGHCFPPPIGHRLGASTNIPSFPHVLPFQRILPLSAHVGYLASCILDAPPIDFYRLRLCSVFTYISLSLHIATVMSLDYYYRFA